MSFHTAWVMNRPRATVASSPLGLNKQTSLTAAGADIDTAVVDGLNVLDPKRPIREPDI